MVGKKSGFRISKMSLIFYNTGGFKINFFHRIYSVVMSYSPLNSWWYKNCLTVNSIWGSGTTPLTEKKFVKKNSKCNLDDFLLVLPKSYWTTFKTISKLYQLWGACHVTIIGGVAYKKSIIFKVLGVYL